MFYLKNERIAHSLFFSEHVSESLRSLTKNERCERIAQVAHQKWVTMSDLLTSRRGNERSWGNRSGRSPKMSEWVKRSSFWANHSIAHFWAKNRWTKSQPWKLMRDAVAHIRSENWQEILWLILYPETDGRCCGSCKIWKLIRDMVTHFISGNWWEMLWLMKDLKTDKRYGDSFYIRKLVRDAVAHPQLRGRRTIWYSQYEWLFLLKFLCTKIVKQFVFIVQSIVFIYVSKFMKHQCFHKYLSTFCLVWNWVSYTVWYSGAM